MLFRSIVFQHCERPQVKRHAIHSNEILVATVVQFRSVVGSSWRPSRIDLINGVPRSATSVLRLQFAHDKNISRGLPTLDETAQRENGPGKLERVVGMPHSQPLQKLVNNAIKRHALMKNVAG